MPLVLASRSPRRSELLAAAGYAFEVDAEDVDETPRADEPAEAYVVRLAREKGAVVARRRRDAVVLAADTTVVVGGRMLGKPASDAEVGAMIERLSGRSHEVLTGVAIWHQDQVRAAHARTIVAVAALSAEDIAWYVGSGEGRDKAGGYGIQGLFSRFVERIDGSYSNVVGLPLAQVAALLRDAAPAGAFDADADDLSSRRGRGPRRLTAFERGQ